MSGAMLFIGWFILAFVVAKYASNKGRSGLAWLLVALLFSPLIAWIILLVAPKNTAKLEARAIKNGDLKRCPACAEPIRAEAVKCRHCGHEFTATRAAIVTK